MSHDDMIHAWEPRGMFQQTRDEAGLLRNLAWHSILVLDPDYLTDRRYPESMPILPAAAERLREPRLAAQVEAIGEAVRLICNIREIDVRARKGDSWALIDLSRLLRGVMGDLLKRTDERSLGIRRQVRAVLEKALTHWPTAFCWHAYESFEADSDKATFLAHLAVTMTHAENGDEFEFARATHGWAVGVLQKKWQLQPSAPGPGSLNPESDSLDAHLTGSQRHVLGECTRLGEAFYGERRAGLQLEPRLFPLVVAPTGSGKTHLTRLLARRLRADLVRIHRANYIPQGARTRPTIFRVCEQLARRPGRRVLVHVDELDKFRVDSGAATPGSDWGSSVFGDIFDILAGDFPVDNYLAEEGGKLKDTISADELRDRAKRNVFVVGTGTFQRVFEAAARRAVGFASARSEKSVSFEDIVDSGIVSRELLARFHTPALVLANPEPAEVRTLIERNGIATLAREVGYNLTEQDLDIRSTGFRGLESLASRLLLMRDAPNCSANEAAKLPDKLVGDDPLSLIR